ncbi:TPA: hypothetical protein QB072_001146 [Pasteurella multocida]|uniref:hypothetical protein n=1 Tax=Pasteurella multocida TaxID=747 RepID=UPI00027B1EBD|nr:hypothetical protein [Pasteurella multocida]APB78588.1 hypothetical protein BMF22_00435 [Pasteurella multocida]ATC22314.1 hypothetical protein CLD34_03380 [Pasteurella multocida]EJS83489.1 hypothetical protein KCU_10531 [Pasteurella multocida subsp. multocida str. P52VAC]EPE75280.1 hypothetical protein I010_07071 [Pasteurella multocida 1500C]ERL41296.1 hypothetical protein B654_05721 [Pasteurella multocida subsp. multocida str. PMTB]
MKKQYNPLAGEMMTPHNSEVYMHLAMLELATLECEALGIEVEKVEWFDTGRPRLVARDNTTTRKMAQNQRAFNYGTEVKNGTRRYLMQMTIKGVKVIWSTDTIKH